MPSLNDVWSYMHVLASDHRNKVSNILRGHRVPKKVRDKIWWLMHKQTVEMSEKITRDLNMRKIQEMADRVCFEVSGETALQLREFLYSNPFTETHITEIRDGDPMIPKWSVSMNVEDQDAFMEWRKHLPILWK